MIENRTMAGDFGLREDGDLCFCTVRGDNVWGDGASFRLGPGEEADFIREGDSRETLFLHFACNVGDECIGTCRSAVGLSVDLERALPDRDMSVCTAMWATSTSSSASSAVHLGFLEISERNQSLWLPQNSLTVSFRKGILW